MKTSNWLSLGFAVFALPLALAGCGGGATEGGGDALPAQGAATVKAWLTKGSYKTWEHRETAAHEGRSPSPHGVNQIYNNELLGDNAPGAAFPKDAAAVKELYDTVGGPIVGYAYYAKIQADTAEGKGWYYFEEKPIGMTIADGVGAMGCIKCHSQAGVDDAHLKAGGAHDYVYTQLGHAE